MCVIEVGTEETKSSKGKNKMSMTKGIDISIITYYNSVKVSSDSLHQINFPFLCSSILS